ncbi:hypothetical protein IW262DRAFT_1417965 [Armillaria fumosa]|nr:hypothetical protein IW262DRAFT_1421318 [Armillaria fumosa]KAK0209451.1 hypothetical protein IW262DRAFT_1417965 [Armillaria fumosa]
MKGQLRVIFFLLRATVISSSSKVLLDVDAVAFRTTSFFDCVPLAPSIGALLPDAVLKATHSCCTGWPSVPRFRFCRQPQ